MVSLEQTILMCIVGVVDSTCTCIYALNNFSEEYHVASFVSCTDIMAEKKLRFNQEIKVIRFLSPYCSSIVQW